MSIFNRRTDIGMRTKRISQCCSVSHKRESQAIDLLLTRYENQFLSQYIGVISQNVNWYSFSYCLETFENEFIQNANGYIQIQLQKEFTYDKSCPKVIPENLYVFFSKFILHSLITGVLFWSIFLFLGCMSRKWIKQKFDVVCFLDYSRKLQMRRFFGKWRLLLKIRTLIWNLFYLLRMLYNRWFH